MFCPSGADSSIGCLPLGGMAIGTRRADVDEAIDALARGGLGESPRRVDASGLKLAPPAPVADLGRAVKDAADAATAALQVAWIGQVAANDFDAQRVRKSVRLPGRTRARTRSPLRGQSLGQMTAQQARGPGDQDLVAASRRSSFALVLDQRSLANPALGAVRH